MITGLDHIVLVCPNIDDGVEAYAGIVGREPDWRSSDAAGSSSAFFQLGNVALELLAPSGPGPLGRRLRTMLEEGGAGVKSLCFSASDLAGTHRVFERRGLKPEDLQHGESIDAKRQQVRSWNRFRIDESASHGVRLFVLERRLPDPIPARIEAHAAAGEIAALDHVVITTHAPERAVALYAGRLGLSFALDRVNPSLDTRFLFFLAGAVRIELTHKVSAGVNSSPDRLWGLSWRVRDIEAAHARLSASGFSVSEVRKGRRSGSNVFTLRDQTLGVPTLILSETPLAGAAGGLE